MSDIIINITIVLCAIILSFFFSGVEIAFISCNKLRIEILIRRGTVGESSFFKKIFDKRRIMDLFFKNPSHFIATMLVGNTISLVLYTYYLSLIIHPYINSFIPDSSYKYIMEVIIESFTSTFIIIIIGEYTPKIIFMMNANKLLFQLLIPIVFFYYLLFPIVCLLVYLYFFIVKYIFKLTYTNENPVFGLIDLNQYLENISLSEIKIKEHNLDMKMFFKTIDFFKLKIRDCMLKKENVIAINITDDITSIKKKFIETKLSRILVYRGSVQNIIGYIHIRSIFHNLIHIEDNIYPCIFFEENVMAYTVLVEMLQKRKSIGVVINAKKEFLGILTTKTLVQQILGDIKDDQTQYHHEFTQYEEQINENEYIFAAHLKIEYINQRYQGKFYLPTGDYETLSGLILSYNKDIPQVNNVLVISDYVFKIISMTKYKIDKVSIKKIETSLIKKIQ